MCIFRVIIILDTSFPLRHLRSLISDEFSRHWVLSGATQHTMSRQNEESKIWNTLFLERKSNSLPSRSQSLDNFNIVIIYTRKNTVTIVIKIDINKIIANLCCSRFMQNCWYFDHFFLWKIFMMYIYTKNSFYRLLILGSVFCEWRSSSKGLRFV